MNKNYMLYTLILFLAFSLNIKSQIVNIPDPNFKNVLLQGQAGINTNGDNEIQISEAIAFTGTIDCSGQNIKDLTGIEAFVNLKKLYCYGNQHSARTAPGTPMPRACKPTAALRR